MSAQYYIIRAEANREAVARFWLRRAGIEAYLPLEKFRLKRRRRWVTVEKPLFRGYLFAPCGSFPGEEIAIERANGVYRLLPTPGDPDGTPARLSGKYIADLMAMETAGVFDHSAAAIAKRKMRRAVNLFSEEAKEHLTGLVESRYGCDSVSRYALEPRVYRGGLLSGATS